MATIHPLTLNRLENAFLAGDMRTHAHLLAKCVRRGAMDVASAFKSHVLGDDWLDFANEGLAQYWASQSGYLYVAVNPVTPNFYKVGKTRAAPEHRMKKLNNEAVVGKIICVQSWAVHDRHYLESSAHQHLKHLPRHKEYFHGSWSAVCGPTLHAIEADILRFEQQGFVVPELTSHKNNNGNPSNAHHDSP